MKVRKWLSGILGCVVFAAMTTFAVAPSSIPEQDITGQKKYVERWRVLADLDGDGVEDMILSGNPSMFGNGGGGWDVYLNRDGEFKRIGRIGAHPKAISIEADQDRFKDNIDKRRYVRIWTFWHSSCASGALGYCRVGEKSVDEFCGLEIYPGDSGTSLGNEVYDAVFKTSPVPFILERSSTDEKGHVEWEKI